MTRESRKFSRPALTLTEVLVVVALLGMIATGAVPSVQVILSRAKSQDVEQRILSSWQLGIASARAQQRPVRWQLSAEPDFCQIKILSADDEVLFSTRIQCRNVHWNAEGDAKRALSCVLYPHGLTDEFKISWDSESGIQQLRLGLAPGL
jgi:prepilin-type N-terminal cleavage/methylation domain-containing protein